jgi:hypothetical protein
MPAPRVVPLLAPMSGGYRFCNSSVFALLLVPLVRKQQADTRGPGCSTVCRPHQSPDCELWLKVSWRGEPPCTANRQIRWPRVDPAVWRVSQGRQKPAGQSRPSPAMAKSTKQIVFGAYQPSAFRLPWLRFSVIFLGCKANVRVYDAKSGHGPHSPPQARRLHLSAWKSRFCNEASLGSESRQPTNQSLSHK